MDGDWDAFARANQGGDRCRSDRVVGRSVWDFVAGLEAQQLYQELFRRVRGGAEIGAIPFRCDSPDTRRFLTLELALLESGGIRLTTVHRADEDRPRAALLDVAAPRASAIVRICSICKQVATPRDVWVEVEEATRLLRLFERDAMPELTHGVCPSCHAVALGDGHPGAGC